MSCWERNACRPSTQTRTGEAVRASRLIRVHRHVHGHVSARVWPVRLYGAGRDRMLYGCEPVDTRKRPHTFAAKLPRVRVDNGQCDACEHLFGTHDGHQATREYSFTAREIATALSRSGGASPTPRLRRTSAPMQAGGPISRRTRLWS